MPSTINRMDRVFYGGMAIAIVAAVFTGFAPTYYLRSHFQTTPLPLLLHLHGFVFTCWILLFAVQTTLISARRIDLHRRLGWVGAGLAAALVPIGLAAGIDLLRRSYPSSANEASTFFTTPVSAVVIFGFLVAVAVRYRRQTETHKRLMLLATISILDAAVARWPSELLATSDLAEYVVIDSFIVVGVLYDLYSRRRIHPANLWGGLLIIVVQSLRVPVGQTEAWHAFARLLAG